MKIKKLNTEIFTEADEKVNQANIPTSVEAEVAQAENKLDAEDTIVDLDKRTSPIIENEITRTLQRALVNTLISKKKKRGFSDNANILISGLPGSGKSAVVYDWASHALGGDWDYVKNEAITNEEDKKIHLLYVNIKNNELDAYINGYPAESTDHPDKVTHKFSDALDFLDRPNSVLFIDEYNRQTKDQIRGSVLTLINEHRVAGKDKQGQRYFPNFLFTVAVMNPALGKHLDSGAAELNDAETTRFIYDLRNQNSDKDTAYHLINKSYLADAKAEAADKNPDFKRIEKILRIRDLGLFIVGDARFHFDGELLPSEREKLIQEIKNNHTIFNPKQINRYLSAELDKLELNLTTKLRLAHKKEFNMRALTSALNTLSTELDYSDLGHEVEYFEDWLAGNGHLLDDTDLMLWKILNDYHTPTKELLFKEAGIELPEADKNAEAKAKNEPKSEINNSKEPDSSDSEADALGKAKEDDIDIFHQDGDIENATEDEVSAKIMAAVGKL